MAFNYPTTSSFIPLVRTDTPQQTGHTAILQALLIAGAKVDQARPP